MGADPVDEAAIIAWVDGELHGAEAHRVEAAVANDADWRALAERHRRMKARFAAAFDPIARPPAEVISLAEVRAKRAAAAAAAPASTPTNGWRRWAAGGAIAASLVAGLFVFQGRDGMSGGAVPAPVAVALNDQLSGNPGPVRIALSFRDRSGQYCRSFTGETLSGVACRAGKDWQMRYTAPGAAPTTEYRMAGTDGARAKAIMGMIAGEPLDRAQEAAARRGDWR